MQTKQMSNLSLGGSRSTLSMQSMGSSEAIIMPPPDTILQNQTFPVIYKNRAYMVDPNGLINSSFKVKELINPFLKNNFQITELRLQVVYCIFSNHNMENFLRICQNLPADVRNSEMKEICDIAKMFQADNIYNCGIDFIHKYYRS